MRPAMHIKDFTSFYFMIIIAWVLNLWTKLGEIRAVPKGVGVETYKIMF